MEAVGPVKLAVSLTNTRNTTEPLRTVGAATTFSTNSNHSSIEHKVPKQQPLTINRLLHAHLTSSGLAPSGFETSKETRGSIVLELGE
jgi:hypothetical protein